MHSALKPVKRPSFAQLASALLLPTLAMACSSNGSDSQGLTPPPFTGTGGAGQGGSSAGHAGQGGTAGTSGKGGAGQASGSAGAAGQGGSSGAGSAGAASAGTGGSQAGKAGGGGAGQAGSGTAGSAAAGATGGTAGATAGGAGQAGKSTTTGGAAGATVGGAGGVSGEGGSSTGQVCGDNIKEGSEPCDGADLGGQTCATVTGDPNAAGTLTCNPNCTLNSSGCGFCGDGVVNNGEACDGSNLNGATCVSVTNDPNAQGTPTCKPDCSVVSSVGCQYCGDGVIDTPEEQCDGADLGGQTCASTTGDMNEEGTLGCGAGCLFNTSACVPCDNASGCWACPPTTQDQFLNQCTSSTCFPFDNAKRLPLYNNGNLPPLTGGLGQATGGGRGREACTGLAGA